MSLDFACVCRTEDKIAALLWLVQECQATFPQNMLLDFAHVCRAEDKIAALLWLVREAIEEGQPTLVFASTRHHVEFLYTLMTREGIDAACVYGAMDQVTFTAHC